MILAGTFILLFIFLKAMISLCLNDIGFSIINIISGFEIILISYFLLLLPHKNINININPKTNSGKHNRYILRTLKYIFFLLVISSLSNIIESCLEEKIKSAKYEDVIAHFMGMEYFLFLKQHITHLLCHFHWLVCAIFLSAGIGLIKNFTLLILKLMK